MCHDGGMDTDQPFEEDVDARILQFWVRNKGYAGVGDLDIVVGPQWGEAVPPPAWSYSETPKLADQFVDLILTRQKTASTSLRQDYEEDEQLPKAGDCSIILDGSGTPQVLIRTTEIEVVPFCEVSLTQALAEGDCDDLESWRQTRLDEWEQSGLEVDDSSLVVWERFKVLYPS